MISTLHITNPTLAAARPRVAGAVSPSASAWRGSWVDDAYCADRSNSQASTVSVVGLPVIFGHMGTTGTTGSKRLGPGHLDEVLT